ncbi:MAG: type II toxin-antitoxin system PrlF family antitoxin [Deltaproteobacteria bacterium]|nr:type II toxin-antitoxin system PrlF family antitoxin [Deltaproteobacteria bacterium]
MATATLTSKGQTTVPKEVRDFLGLHEGDQIEFVIGRGEVVLRPATLDVKSLKGILREKDQKTLSVEEMNTAIKHRFRNLHPK